MNDTTKHDRRTVLKMAGAGGVTLATITFVSACGSGEKKGGSAGEEVSPEVKAAVQQVVSSDEVPVGKAKFLEKERVVVTQPKAGEYKVFSDVCHHQNGRVTMQDEQTGRLVCVLHGSQFDPATGEVLVGPAANGLTPLPVDAGPTA